MSKRLPSYGKVFNFGNRNIANVFDGPVWVQEKLDGSQFTFGWIDGEMVFCSKNNDVIPGQDKNFDATTKALLELEAQGKFDGYKHLIFRGEAFRSKKHNTLNYERCPKHHVVIFDIQCSETPGDNWIHPDNMTEICRIIGLEFIQPVLHQISSREDVKDQLELPSMLGGQREGIVFKNYNQFYEVGGHTYPQFAKFVREVFREKNSKEWKKQNPGQKDFLFTLSEYLTTTARWDKAIQHLRDDGKLQFDPQDIPNLMKEVQRDILEEEIEDIKERLFKYFWPKLRGKVVAGLPEYYKNYLTELQFEENENEV